MLFMRFPFLLVVFFLLWSGLKIAPLLLFAVAVWVLFGVVARQGYRFEQGHSAEPEMEAYV